MAIHSQLVERKVQIGRLQAETWSLFSPSLLKMKQRRSHMGRLNFRQRFETCPQPLTPMNEVRLKHHRRKKGLCLKACSQACSHSALQKRRRFQ
jgi:hypothetical protein